MCRRSALVPFLHSDTQSAQSYSQVIFHTRLEQGRVNTHFKTLSGSILSRLGGGSTSCRRVGKDKTEENNLKRICKKRQRQVKSWRHKKKCLWQFITRKCKMLIIKSLLCVQEKKNLRNYMKTRRQKCNLLQNFGIRYCTCSWFIRQTQTSGFRLHRRLAQVCDVSL